MTPRLTEKKCEAWASRLDRAHKTIANVLAEQRGFLASAKGGNLTDLQAAVVRTTEARNAADLACETTADLYGGVQRRKRAKA